MNMHPFTYLLAALIAVATITQALPTSETSVASFITKRGKAPLTITMYYDTDCKGDGISLSMDFYRERPGGLS